MTIARGEIVSQEYQFGFHDDVTYLAQTKVGLTRQTVEEISGFKAEPDWMLQFRLRAYDHFLARAMPSWVPESVQNIDFSKIVYYRKPSEGEEKSWDDVPDKIKQTFEKLGIPEAERKFLAGVGAQYDSEVVYHSVREELSKIGVVFMGMDQGLREYPDIVKKYFGTVIPPEDNKFAALNSAVWSGGSFVYVPKGVEVPLPLQAYFRINGENTGQFERTLIIADEGSKVHYIEGCTAPIYTTDALHAAVVEVIALPGLADPLHDDPELEPRRLQPGDEAGPRPRALHGRVGRREHRLARDGEVPGDLPARRGRHGRGDQRRLRRPRAAPGHGRQGGPPGPEHAEPDRQQVGQQGRRPLHLPRHAQGGARRDRRGRQRPLRRPAPRRGEPVATPTRTSTSRKTTRR